MNKHLNDFLFAAVGSNDSNRARQALEMGLNKNTQEFEPSEQFTFENQRTWLAISGSRGVKIPELMLDFGFDLNVMKEIATRQGKADVLELVARKKVEIEKVILDENTTSGKPNLNESNLKI